MVLGSHNAWSYLPVKNWWIRPFSFIYKCQEVDIKTQYNLYKSRCFDLRIRFNKKGEMVIAHGLAVFKITEKELWEQLEWLDSRTDCYLRVIHETRTKRQHTVQSTALFQAFCNELELKLKHTILWCGENLYDNEEDYIFGNYPRCLELYSSVTKPWHDTPKCYAKKNNLVNITLSQTSRYDILLIDFINIQD